MKKGYVVVLLFLCLFYCRSEKEQCQDELRESEFIPFCPAYVLIPKGSTPEAQGIPNALLLLCVQNLVAREKCNAESTIPEFEPLGP